MKRVVGPAPQVVVVGFLCLALWLPLAGWNIHAAIQNFDHVPEPDKKLFSKRFEKEIWPLLTRNAKDGCVGCHTKTHRSSLRFAGEADADFRMLLKQGFFLVDDPGSVLHVVSTSNKKERMPPGDRPGWTSEEADVLRQFVVDLDKKQQR